MLSLIGQQSGLDKAKPLCMHNKTLIAGVAGGPRQGVIIMPAVPARKAEKGFASRAFRVISVGLEPRSVADYRASIRRTAVNLKLLSFCGKLV
jgi:hypothetical protein